MNVGCDHAVFTSANLVSVVTFRNFLSRMTEKWAITLCEDNREVEFIVLDVVILSKLLSCLEFLLVFLTVEH